MQLSEILQQPEGFTPPSVTVKIKKVWDYKAGVGDNGSWSYQSIDVEGGRLNLKNLAEFPKAREGQTVTLRANESKQHGLTGIKVNHNQHNGRTYHQLIITNSCKWEWGPNGTSASAAQPNSNHPPASQPSGIDMREYLDHLLSCASVTNMVTEQLGVTDPQAMQACFATICIDAKNRGVMFPRTLPSLNTPEKTEQGDPYTDAPPSIVDDSDLPDDYEPNPPF